MSGGWDKQCEQSKKEALKLREWRRNKIDRNRFREAIERKEKESVSEEIAMQE
jgi:hypothetical protein